MILIPLYKLYLLKNISKCLYEYKNFKPVLFISYIKLLVFIVFVFLFFGQNLSIQTFLCISYIKFLLSIVFIFIIFQTKSQYSFLCISCIKFLLSISYTKFLLSTDFVLLDKISIFSSLINGKNQRYKH